MCSGIGETWGLSTNEAMNFNLPVVISSLTGCSSNLVDKNCYIFKTGDVKDLSLKIKMFFKNNLELRKEMGLKSKEIISKYSYEKIINGLKKII
jgi:glycosyltransferase involved in cell wall biosynthesis